MNLVETRREVSILSPDSVTVGFSLMSIGINSRLPFVSLDTFTPGKSSADNTYPLSEDANTVKLHIIHIQSEISV
mgnify:CR=1 FL=1